LDCSQVRVPSPKAKWTTTIRQITQRKDRSRRRVRNFIPHGQF